MKYYSETLQKANKQYLFDTEEDLKKAEKDYQLSKKEQDKKLAIKKAKAEEITKAYKHIEEVKKTCRDMIKQAEDEYLKKRQEFINEYGSFHMTYSNQDGDECVAIGDLFGDLFNLFF